jgi:hypothetical protein
MQQLPVLQRCPLQQGVRQRSSRHICQTVQELNAQVRQLLHAIAINCFHQTASLCSVA